MQEEIYKNLSLEDLPGEVWKLLPESNGNYYVSNLGRIKSVDFYIHFKDGRNPSFRKGRILKQFPNWQGYLSCRVTGKNNDKIRVSIHKAVCNLFNPNPDNLPCVNHKDENKQNNRWNNLEHCTYSYNITYGSRKGEKDIPVAQYSLDGDLIKTYKSATEAANILGISEKNITNCTNGWSNTAFEYMWKKIDGEVYNKIPPYIHPVKKKVNCYDLDGNYISTYESIADAARNTGLCVTCISHNCHNKRKNVENRIFKFV